MPEELREGGCDGRLVDDSDNVAGKNPDGRLVDPGEFIDADDRHQKEISKAAQEYLEKLRIEPIVIVP